MKEQTIRYDGHTGPYALNFQDAPAARNQMGIIAGFALKRDAVAFAKQQGWSARDVRRAWTVFCTSWVVAQPQNNERTLWRCLTKPWVDERWVDVE